MDFLAYCSVMIIIIKIIMIKKVNRKKRADINNEAGTNFCSYVKCKIERKLLSMRQSDKMEV